MQFKDFSLFSKHTSSTHYRRKLTTKTHSTSVHSSKSYSWWSITINSRWPNIWCLLKSPMINIISKTHYWFSLQLLIVQPHKLRHTKMTSQNLFWHQRQQSLSGKISHLFFKNMDWIVSYLYPNLSSQSRKKRLNRIRKRLKSWINKNKEASILSDVVRCLISSWRKIAEMMPFSF